MNASRLTAAAKQTVNSTYFWAPLGVLGAIALVGEMLTGRYRVLSTSAVIAVIVIAVSLESYAYFEERHLRYSRAFVATALLVALVTILEMQGVAHLIRLLVSGGQGVQGFQLLVSGAYYWISNVLAFGLWFWLIDRGGPPARAKNERAPADFYFPEMEADEYAPPNWSPSLLQYMYLAFTNATAFSPTDTLPLSDRARVLMLAESILSLVVVILVAGRAVNILH